MKGFFASSSVQSASPAAVLIPRCGACGIYRKCQSPKMEPYGKGLRSVLVVGEAPGQTEDEEGRPFVGKAGQFLREELKRLGLNLDRDAVTTNALICRPPHNATPDIKQIEYCRPNLTKTIAHNQPTVIVTLGRSALVSVVQDYWRSEVGALERWIGNVIPLGSFWLCPTYHPSFLLRSHNTLLDRAFSDHLETAFQIKEQPEKPEDYQAQVECLYEERAVYEALREIDSKGGWAAVDYETNCLKPEYPQARIVSCAVSNGKRTISFPWHGRAREAASKFLRSDRTTKIASNLKFEQRWTKEHLGHRVRNWGWDTMLAAHCLDNRQGICSLKFQAFVNLGVPSYNESIVPYLENYRGLYNRIQEIDLKDLLTYGGMDALLEHRLAKRQREIMGYKDES